MVDVLSIVSWVLSVSFDHSSGPYKISDWKSDWTPPSFVVESGRPTKQSRIKKIDQNSALEITYPKKKFGGNSTAFWNLKLPPEDCAVLSYHLLFDKKFDFVKGGKLPGLGGGTHNTGKKKPTGFDGFSVRTMWRAGGRMVQYVYHPNQPENHGEDFAWQHEGEAVSLTPGEWYTIETEVRLNDVGERNGVIKTRLSGRQVFYGDDFELRKTPELKLDAMLFQTFFGGDSADWAPKKKQKAYFDEVIVRACAPSM